MARARARFRRDDGEHMPPPESCPENSPWNPLRVITRSATTCDGTSPPTLEAWCPSENPAVTLPRHHGLMACCIDAGHPEKHPADPRPPCDSRIREWNKLQYPLVSMSIPSAQTSWTEASFDERVKIHQQHRDYTHGMLWFLKTDERVPARMRNEMARDGFCKDEWQAPHQPVLFTWTTPSHSGQRHPL